MAKSDDKLTGKEYKERYSGMKKAPESCLQIVKDARITKEKAKRRIQMKKVRPYESIEAWGRRVRKYNLVSEAEIQKKINSNKYVYKAQVRTKEDQRKYRKQKNRTIKVIFNEKEHDFLKYYGIILNYYSLKYGIRKVDLEVCFAFYNNKIIDVDRFNNICILNNGSSTGMLSRFKKNGYISELINKQEFEVKDNREVKTNFYKLSLSMTKLITHIYEKIAKLNTLKKHGYKGMYSPECEKEIIAMNDEINDYLELNRKQLELNSI